MSTRPARILLSAKHRHELLSPVPRDLFRFLCLLAHDLDTRIRAEFVLTHPLPQLPRIPGLLTHEVLAHPVVQLFHVRDRVDQSTGSRDERVLGVQLRRHDARLVFPLLEVRVRETEEDLGQLRTLEIVGQEFHRVRPQRRDVLVQPWPWPWPWPRCFLGRGCRSGGRGGRVVLSSQCGDSADHVVGHLRP